MLQTAVNFSQSSVHHFDRQMTARELSLEPTVNSTFSFLLVFDNTENMANISINKTCLFDRLLYCIPVKILL